MRLFITANYIIITIMTSIVPAQKDAHFTVARNTIVHLFEWKWNDVAAECENFLQYKGFGGVQISPPNENLIVNGRPWWERYQPVSYKLVTRSGTEAEFMEMIRRCNRVGIRIYVDAVINHMTASGGRGTAGSTCTPKNYPGVPYIERDFHASCSIENYNDAGNVRVCELVGLQDLDQSKESVREKIVDYLNKLIDFGVAGFRVDAAKHILPADLQAIYSNLKNLSTNHGFKNNLRPFIYQEVIDYGGEAIHKYEYTSIGAVLEFKYGFELGKAFQGNNKLSYLDSWGEKWGLINSLDAVAFIDNHDNQRTGPSEILTYKNPKKYKMAIAFMLAHPYGTTRLMSGYHFDGKDVGPPKNSKEEILGPDFRPDNTCTNGWVCEHRWRQIYNMVRFRNAVFGTGILNWWSNGDQQIAFARNGKGFIVFTVKGDIKRWFNTSLPGGIYCDVISGEVINGKCTGKMITVDKNGFAKINLLENEEDGVLAINDGVKL